MVASGNKQARRLGMSVVMKVGPPHGNNVNGRCVWTHEEEQGSLIRYSRVVYHQKWARTAKAAADSTAKLPPLAVMTARRATLGKPYRYLALFSHREGGADACTEGSHASSPRGVAAQVGPRAQRSQDRSQPRY